MLFFLKSELHLFNTLILIIISLKSIYTLHIFTENEKFTFIIRHYFRFVVGVNVHLMRRVDNMPFIWVIIIISVSAAMTSSVTEPDKGEGEPPFENQDFNTPMSFSYW